MAPVATNLIAGPATLWRADFGATEAADTAVATEPTDPFVDLGGTNDGVSYVVDREFHALTIDQVTMAVGRRKTKNDVSISTNLAEPTLENWALALNQAASSVTSGGTGATAYKALELETGDAGDEPEYSCVLLRGRAPNGKKRNVIIRKALSIESVESAYKKDEQTLIPVTFTAHWISASIKPVKWVDSTAV